MPVLSPRFERKKNLLRKEINIQCAYFWMACRLNMEVIKVLIRKSAFKKALRHQFPFGAIWIKVNWLRIPLIRCVCLVHKSSNDKMIPFMDHTVHLLRLKLSSMTIHTKDILNVNKRGLKALHGLSHQIISLLMKKTVHNNSSTA